MGLVYAFKGALSGTLDDQWKDVIVPLGFDEFSAVVPGILHAPPKCS